MKPVSVTLDSYYGDQSAVFHGFTTGELWNGFVTPYFDHAETERLARWLDREFRDLPDEAIFVEWSDDAATFVAVEADESYPIATIVDDEHGTLYGVGAYSWTWVEAPTSSSATPPAVASQVLAIRARHGAAAEDAVFLTPQEEADFLAACAAGNVGAFDGGSIPLDDQYDLLWMAMPDMIDHAENSVPPSFGLTWMVHPNA